MRQDTTLDPEVLTERLAPLLADGSARLDVVGLPVETLKALGFHVDQSEVRLPPGLERLDETRILTMLDERARRWLTDLTVLEVVGSTNALLNEAAADRSIAGMVRLAELQVQGRGRRGRSWASPYASNLALSVGARLPQSPDQLGGFSLCIGLAVADRLQTLEAPDVSLKWPNDVLVGGRKVAGILVELHRAGAASEVVVGVGINFRLPEAVRAGIEQPVTDLEEAGLHLSRNQLAAGLISSLVDYIEVFAADGFPPMTGAFDALHRYHRQTCTVLLGNETVTGKVAGVSNQGELLLEIDGRIRRFSAGEVSLRPV